MKNIFIICSLLLSSIAQGQTFKFHQTDNVHNQLRLNTKTGEVIQIQDDNQRWLVHPVTTKENEMAGRYQLFKTKNMWTFILLDRFTGSLWQCQYSIDGDEYRKSIPINLSWLAVPETTTFTIEPLISMFQYYLINEESGAMWKFQWSIDGDDYRWIERM